MGSGVDSISVYLEHDIDEQYQYAPGEILRGKVVLDVLRKTLIRKIFVIIRGEGVVAWEDSQYGSFQAAEEYVNLAHIIVEHSHPNLLVLNKGHHEFPFEYHLPENIPSSFIGKFGSVTYVIKGTANGQNPGETSITSEPFLVLRRLKMPEQCKNSVHGQRSKRMWSTCSTGKITLNANLSQVGGTQGEDIYLNAEILNRSPCRVTAIQASLIMNSLYSAKKRAIPFRQIVNKRRDDYEVSSKTGRRWENIRLSLPPYIPETRLEYCDIIEITYTIQFRVEIVGGKEIILEFPFFISTDHDDRHITSAKKRDFNNRQWNLSSKELQLDDVDLKMGDYNRDENEWYGDNVPELRNDKKEVKNPLFEEHRRTSTRINVNNFNPTLEELPEIMENTKL